MSACVNAVSFVLPMAPSANELFRNVPGVGRVKARAYKDFTAMAVAAIRRQKVSPLKEYCVFIAGLERRSLQADVDNRLKAMIDAIVTAGVIEDDRFITAIFTTWNPLAHGLARVQLIPARHKLQLEFHPSQDGASGAILWTAPSAEQERRHDSCLSA